MQFGTRSYFLAKDLITFLTVVILPLLASKLIIDTWDETFQAPKNPEEPHLAQIYSRNVSISSE